MNFPNFSQLAQGAIFTLGLVIAPLAAVGQATDPAPRPEVESTRVEVDDDYDMGSWGLVGLLGLLGLAGLIRRPTTPVRIERDRDDINRDNINRRQL